MAQVNDWDVTDANNNAAPPNGWPEGTMQYSQVNDTGRQVQGAVRRMWGDMNGALVAGGVANAYTVTLNSPYTSYFAGMYIACQINAANTGATTLNVNGIGVQSVVARDGSALAPGVIDAGGIYEFRYDGTNFQLMGTLGGDVAVDQATLSNPNDPDLVDTNVALRVGAANPDTGQHMEIGRSGIEAKTDATTGTILFLSPNTAAAFVGGGAGQTGNGALFVNAVTGGVSSVALAEALLPAMDLFYDGSANRGGVLLYTAGQPFQVRDDSGNVSAAFTPNDDVELYDANVAVFRTVPAGSGGAQVNNTSTGGGFERVLTASDLSGLTFAGLSDTNTAGLAANDFTYWNGSDWVPSDTLVRATSGVVIQPESGDIPILSLASSSGTQQAAMFATPLFMTFTASLDQTIAMQFSGFENAIVCTHGDDVALFDAGVEVARTLPAASGGFEANNTLTGAGFERVLTESDLGSTGNSTETFSGILTADGKTASTATQALHTVSYGPSSANIAHTYSGVLFSFNSTVGTNPGARFQINGNGGTYGDNYGVFNTHRTDTDQRQTDEISVGGAGTSITNIPVGGLTGVTAHTYEGVIEPSANSQTSTVRGGQNITNGGSPTLFLRGSRFRVDRWS